MRKTIEKQLKIGQVDICNIQIDLRSRNEILSVRGEKVMTRKGNILTKF